MSLKKGFCLLFILSLMMPAFGQDFQKLGPPVNVGSGRQSSPAISPDGTMLAFTSDRSGSWKLYVSERSSGGWGDAQPVEAVNGMFGQPPEFAGTCFNYNHSRIYFAAYPQGKSGKANIYYTEFSQNQWQQPVKLPDLINTSRYEGMPSLALDGNRLFFTRVKTGIEDRDLEDKACKSLYFAQKEGPGPWQESRKLPSPVNGSCESSPFILSDGTTLLLSSIREPKTDENGDPAETRYGGYDLYQSKNLAQRIWSAPEIIEAGNPLHDLHISADALNKKAYLAIEDLGNPGKSQIYRLDISSFNVGKPVMVVQGNVNDQYSGQPLQAVIHVKQKSTAKTISTYQSHKDGSFFFVLPADEAYVLDVTKANYSHEFLEYDLSGLQENKVEELSPELYKKIKLRLNVFDREIYQPLEGAITVYQKKGMKPMETKAEMTSPGRYMLDLPIGKAYTIQANKKFYNPYSIDLDLTGVVQFSRFERDMELQPKKKQMEINVSDEETREAMAVEIVITNLDKNEKIVKTAQRNKDGKYMVNLREGDEYEINVKSPKGYAFYNKKVDMNESKKSRKLDVQLKPLKAETKLQLKNITFETNSAALNASSYEELDRVTKLLNDNANIRIEISAHTDDVGSKAYNEKLSDRRAESVVEYLKEQGVSEDQLVSQGYGETRPLLPNTSEENRAKNRRVELEILEVLEDGTVKQRAESKANIEKQDK